MQVKAISAPDEARSSDYPSAGFFLATSRDVASFTMDMDGDDWQTRTPALSAWVAIPVQREVLIAACFADSAGETADAVLRMSVDEVRAWVIGALLSERSVARKLIDTEDFRTGYTRSRRTEDARFYTVVAARVDEAFGFTATAAVPARVESPAPVHPACRARRRSGQLAAAS